LCQALKYDATNNLVETHGAQSWVPFAKKQQQERHLKQSELDGTMLV
jgi:hypothetical protein